MPSFDIVSEVNQVEVHNAVDQCNKEIGAQAVSYTTGVPAVTGAIMMFKGLWTGKGVFNVEQLPPVPFMEEVAKQGLPWHVKPLGKDEQKELLAA